MLRREMNKDEEEEEVSGRKKYSTCPNPHSAFAYREARIGRGTGTMKGWRMG